MTLVIGRCALVAANLVMLMAASTPSNGRAQIAGGDLHVGLWAFLWGETERWPEVGGRLRFGSSGSRTQISLDAGLALAVPYGGSWESLGASVLHEPGVIGRRLWYLGAGYMALHASGAAASGFAHGAQALIGVHLGRWLQSRWSLESHLIVGPDREREDGTEEPVRYLTVGFNWRLGPTSAWREEP